MRYLSASLLVLMLVFSIYETQAGTKTLVAAKARSDDTISGALVGYLLDQEDRQRMENFSPQTLDRIDKSAQLSLRDIEIMANAGMSDNKIIGVIDSTGSVYHLTYSDISSLKSAGVSQSVIDHMLQSGY
jgi:hypothetical protein